MKKIIYIILACYIATFLRLFIDNNFIISIIGSFLFELILIIFGSIEISKLNKYSDCYKTKSTELYDLSLVNIIPPSPVVICLVF